MFGRAVYPGGDAISCTRHLAQFLCGSWQPARLAGPEIVVRPAARAVTWLTT